MVLTGEELEALLSVARAEAREAYPLILFLADSGARFGEAAALRWSDIDLDAGSARIERSFSSGRHLGPTKTGRTRTIELSSRLIGEFRTQRPDICGPEMLAFPGQRGQMHDPNNFRNRVFGQVVRKALGANRRVTPHTLRHTFASLHLSRGTNLLWVQQQGGWTSAKTLLDTYAHFLPSEVAGFADALTALYGTKFPTPQIQFRSQRKNRVAAGS